MNEILRIMSYDIPIRHVTFSICWPVFINATLNTHFAVHSSLLIVTYYHITGILAVY